MAYSANRGNFIWPNLTDEAGAREAARYGWVAAAFGAGVTFVMVAIGKSSIWSLFDVFLLSLVGYGCFKMSRVAAVTGLTFSVLNGLSKYYAHSSFGLMPLLSLFCITAIRGTFFYHKNRKSGNV